MEGDHHHCQNCFSPSCVSAHEGCPLAKCYQCNVTIHRCKLEDHGTICPETTIQCINSQYGCTEQMRRKELGSHLSVCPLIYVPPEPIPSAITLTACEHCSQQMEKIYLQDHYEICDELPVKCTNAYFGCCSVIKRKDMNLHITHCPASITHCGYAYTRSSSNNCWDLEENDNLLPDEQFLLNDYKFRETFNSNESQQLSLHTMKYPVHCHPKLPDDVTSVFLLGKRVCSKGKDFICGNFVRRDEFATHWVSHTELMEDLFFKIRRCPLAGYGCREAMPFFQPLPRGYSFEYKDFLQSFVMVPPQIVQAADGSELKGSYAELIKEKMHLAMYGHEDEGSCNVLGQLPPEVLLLIFSYMDSLSLWSLSQVNNYFRNICEGMLLMSKGIVYSHWEKDTVAEHEVMFIF